MTTEQIEILFQETINNKEAYGKALYNQLEGVTENQVYNWRNQRTKPTIGDMVNVLYQLKKININLKTSSDVQQEEAWEYWGKKPIVPIFTKPFNPFLMKEILDEGFRHPVVIQREFQPEPVVDKNGNKKILEQVTRPNPNT